MEKNIRLVVVVPILLLATLGGCQTPQSANPLAVELAGNDLEAQMAFWHQLTERKVVSNDEGFHGLLLFLESSDPAESYEGRVEILRERQMLPDGFREPPDAALSRGTMAVILARALGIKGGITMRVLGATPRYATRELQYLSIYPRSSPNQTFSGSEFLGIVGRAEDYERSFPIKVPASEFVGGESTEPEGNSTE